MAYNKSDMIYTDYIWSTKYNSDDPRITGEPDRTLLSRLEGWEMLYFINACATAWKWRPNSMASMNRLEQIIRTKVPKNIRSQRDIKAWIESNYKKI